VCIKLNGIRFSSRLGQIDARDTADERPRSGVMIVSELKRAGFTV
jgi:hypothetical protein